MLRTKSFLSPFIKRKKWSINHHYKHISLWLSAELWESKMQKQQINDSTKWTMLCIHVNLKDWDHKCHKSYYYRRFKFLSWLQFRPNFKASDQTGEVVVELKFDIKHTWLFSPSLNKVVRFRSLGAEATCPTICEGSRGTFPCEEHKDKEWFHCWGNLGHRKKLRLYSEWQKHRRQELLPPPY